MDLIEAITRNPIATVTALATLIYSSILLWDRLTDRPKLKIENVSFEEVKEKYHISVEVQNIGRRPARDVRGYLEVLDKNDEHIELYHPENSEEPPMERLPMIWVPTTKAEKSKGYKGRIGDKKLELKESIKLYEEKTRIDIEVGGCNFLRLTRPGMSYSDVFMKLREGGRYRFKVTAKTAKSSTEVTKLAVYPDGFKEEPVM